MDGAILKTRRQALCISPHKFAMLMGNICSEKDLERLEYDGVFTVLRDDVGKRAEEVLGELEEKRKIGGGESELL